MKFHLLEHTKIDVMHTIKPHAINLQIDITKTYPTFNPTLGYSKALEQKRIFDQTYEKYRPIATMLTSSHLFIIVKSINTPHLIRTTNQYSSEHLFNFKKTNAFETAFFNVQINKQPLTNTTYETIASPMMLKTRYTKMYLPTAFFKRGYVHHVNNEYNLFIVLSQSILTILDHLESRGRLKIKLFSTTLDCTVELLWLIAQCFEHVNVFRLELSHGTSKDRYIKFIDFNFDKFVTLRHMFETLTTATKSLSPAMPRGTSIESLYPTGTFDDIADVTNDAFIHHILATKVDAKFQSILTKVQLKINAINEVSTDNLKKCIDWYINHYNLKQLVFIRNEMIVIAKNYCFRNGIQIADQYIDPNLDSVLCNKSKIQIIKSYFPPHHNRDRVRLSIEALYSVSHYKHNERVVQYLTDKQYNVQESTLIDATANVGGVAIYMAQCFKHVVAMEWDSMNFNMLQHNIQLYNIKNIQALKTDCVDEISNRFHTKQTVDNQSVRKQVVAKQTVVFIDPPWGGVDYKSHTRVQLSLGTVDVNDMVLFLVHSVDYVFLKAPMNFHSTVDEPHIHVDRIVFKKYQILVFSLVLI